MEDVKTHSLSISHIYCSTCIITVEGHPFTVCFWGDDGQSRKVLWIGKENNGEIYHWDDYDPSVAHYFPLFNAICNFHLEEFEETTCLLKVATREVEHMSEHMSEHTSTDEL